MFQTLIRPSSGASEYLLCCVGWLEACWCYVAGLSVGDVVSECRLNRSVVVQPTLGYHITSSQSRYITPALLKSAYSSGSACTRIPHHQQTIPLHNTSTPQVSLHNNALDVLTPETCWAVNWHNKASAIKLVYLYSNISRILIIPWLKIYIYFYYYYYYCCCCCYYYYHHYDH